MTEAPLIVTVALDAVSHAYFTGLRDRYFPKHCNYLKAHLTLFHKLPANGPRVDEALKDFSSQQIFTMSVTGVKHLGNGVAFKIESAELMAMHKAMQKRFDPYLISQDRQTLWPHITVQNKVTAHKAQQTAALLQTGFTPFTVTAVGLQSWRYLKGPWEKKEEYLFS